MNVLRLSAIAFGLALAGCLAAPNATLREHALRGEQLALGAAPAPKALDAWWQAYGDEQLNRLMQQALADNPSLAQALARVREAQASADVAHARTLPAVNLDATETRQRFSRDDVIPPPYGGGVHSEGHTWLDFSWDLDFWGRQKSLLEQSRSQSAAAQLDLDGARLALTGAVLEAYIDLDRQYALVELAARSAAQRQQILDITRRRVVAGLDTNVELRQAEGAVPQSQVDLKQAQADSERAVHLLAALSGHGADAYAQIQRPHWRLDAALELPQSLPADLLGRRPDVLAARTRIEAATSGQAAAKAAFYPDINLTAFAGFAAIGAGNLFQSASATYGVGPAIHLPIFDAGRLKAEYRGATAQIDDAVATYNSTVLRAVREAADQLTRIAALGEQLVQQQKALDAAEAAYHLAGERYQAGLSTYLTVLNAETQVLAARRQRVELAAAQANARVGLMLAVGGNFDAHAAEADKSTAAIPAN
jgi:NodT family efflux transporter outer membrane factor (OMF) lipoprotein